MAILKSARQRAAATTKSILGGIKSFFSSSGSSGSKGSTKAGGFGTVVTAPVLSRSQATTTPSTTKSNAFSRDNVSSLGIDTSSLQRTIAPQVYPSSTGGGRATDAGPVIGTYSSPTTVLGGTKTNSVSSEFFNTPEVDPAISGDSLMGGASGGSASSGGVSNISMPSNPGGSNPGVINMGALIGLMSDNYNFDPSTGTFIKKEAKEDPLAVAAENRKKTFKEMLGLMPQKDSLLQSPEVQAQQAEVNRRKEEVNNYTNALNSLMVEQQQKLMGLRDVGAREGVTETVYGQQETAVNRNFAYRALPIQASIAAAQGNLGLAQDYLAQITALKKEDIDNRYAYNVAKYKAVFDFAEKEDQITLNRLIKQEDRLYQARVDNINHAQSLQSQAFNDGNGGLAAQIGSLIADVDKVEPEVFVQRLNAIAGTVAPKPKAEDKPAMAGQTLVMTEESAKDLEAAGIQSQDIISLQKYLNQGYSLEQVAKMTNMPATIQAAFSKYISVPKLGSGLEE